MYGTRSYVMAETGIPIGFTVHSTKKGITEVWMSATPMLQTVAAMASDWSTPKLPTHSTVSSSHDPTHVSRQRTQPSISTVQASASVVGTVLCMQKIIVMEILQIMISPIILMV